ncbi:ABC transporter ATP-binding protein [Phormidium yuhuli AB48]|uniref:ABC transporter ATP-binding protein n=1 Tax=Phormidium yuhuli AB48 TaxID=2940671 RepID=A0ABY5AKT9_9CYAN|nr:ABC transporter ATP-binding protein [Phormidium yuhuli]USR89820.1 ABC transporter ATP-binding protein [Phormidium yuhuli AB48]
MTDTILQLDGLTKHYPQTAVPAVDTVNLSLPKGQILSLLGPSGCGKTTLLRLIAGFERPNDGQIILENRAIAGRGRWIPPEKRNLGMVFQEYALFPHLTVADNIAFGLKKRQLKGGEIKQRVAEALSLVELDGLQNRYPHQLSGGQRQRVALARALAPRPVLMLLDEPLSNLDVRVRLYLRHEIRAILKKTGMTAVFVTHDCEEAMSISDVVGVMRQGRLEQMDSPEAIYREPASRFVAEFVTQANFLQARRSGSEWETELGRFSVAAAGELSGEVGDVMIREEDVRVQPDESGEVQVRDRQFLGREHRYCLQMPSGRCVHARSHEVLGLTIGARVKVEIPQEAARVFPPAQRELTAAAK